MSVEVILYVKHVSSIPPMRLIFLEMINFLTAFIEQVFSDICDHQWRSHLCYLFFLLSASSFLMGQHRSWSILNSNKNSAKFFKQPAKVAASFLVLSWRFLYVLMEMP